MATSKHAGFEFHPLAPERWADLEALFGERGACGGCWCMYWRLPAAQYQAGKGQTNRDALRKLVDGGLASGILAYADGRPIGWCAVEPRSSFVRLNASRVLKSPDEQPVWCAPCLFVHKDYRRQGVSARLLRAAVALAKSRGAKIVEGYPVIPRRENMPAAFAWTGTLASFVAAGFTECVRNSPVRPIMRCYVGTARPTKAKSPAPARKPVGKGARATWAERDKSVRKRATRRSKPR